MSSDSTPRVFISYAHDSDEHRDRVRQFASFLRAQGIDAVLDTWCEGDSQDWYAWAIRELTGADYVLVIASPRYRQVGDGSGPQGIHRGVQSEAALLRELIYGNRDRWRQRILPVLLDGHGPDEIPLFLQPHSASRYAVPAFTVTDAAPLLRVLLRLPGHVPPSVAKPPSLPPGGTPAGWGAFDQLPAQVRDLLRAQESVAAELPYRLRGARQHSLATVYVRQELGTGADAPRPEQPRTEPYRDGKVPVSLPGPPAVRLVVRPPARPIRAALDADDHLLITGGPGQGKSTLSLRLTADIVAVWGAAPGGDTAPLAEPLIPLRLTARELAARRDLPFTQLLAECVRAEYGGLLTADVGEDLLAGRVAGCRWLLLVDGLDEVANADQRDRLVKVLAARAAADGSPHRVVLTTRPIEGAALAPFQQAGAARYELEPFDEAALRDFARNWFRAEGPDIADRFVRQVRAAHLDELVRVPLLATIAVIIFTEYRDVPLPDNQYELYEAYLEFLRSGRPVDDARFEELRIPLLEHLGRVRLETDASLLTAALSWYTSHVPPPHRPATWRDNLTGFLTAVGPLALRGDQLRFLHHSFAEHLAATSMARDLPLEFAEDDSTLSHLLYAARDETTGRYPRTVLLHYTRLRPDQADRLVRWLHTGTPADNLLAARQLAKHAPASTAVVDEFLATVRAWAMSNQHPSNAILEEITRAFHHPGLEPWLISLSADGSAPWESRVIATRALASRPGEPHSDAAADLLESVVQDADLPVTVRLDAAEGLADCGLERRAAAEQALRLVLADPSTPAGRRRSATVVLAGLGPEARAHAVRTLIIALDDPWTPVGDVIEAASALAEIGLEFHDRCAAVFRSIVGTTPSGAEFRDAARGLAALGPQFVNEAADALTAFTAERANAYFDRAQAAETLRELGPLFAATAGELVLSMLAEPATKAYERDRYAHALARLGPDHRASAAKYLTARLNDHDDKDSYYLYEGLIELGPEFHDLAAQHLRQSAEDPLCDWSGRINRLGRLAKLSQAHRAYASERLHAHISDHRLDLDTRIQAASELASLGPEFHRETAAFLVTAIVNSPLDSQQLPFACSLLADLATEHRDLAASRLHDLLRSRHLSRSSMISAASSLSELGPAHRASASTLLTTILRDATRPDAQRVAAAEALIRRGGEYDRTTLSGLLDVLRQQHVDLEFRVGWTAFCSMGIGPRQQLAGALRVHLSDPLAGPKRIVGLATMIAKLSEDHVAVAVAALEGVLADGTAEPFPRFDAGVALVALRPERRAEVVSAIERCVHPVNIFWTLTGACSALAKLGHDATPLIRKVLADDNTERELRRQAATLLADLDRDDISAAANELRRQAADDHLDAETRGEVLMQLTKLDRTAVERCLSFHQHILDDEDQPVGVRCYAAEQVAQLDRTRWPDATAPVRQLLTDPFLSTAADRSTAAQCLKTLNAVGVGEMHLMASALVSDPTASPALRRDAIDLLQGHARLDAQRRQLADHRAWITDRIPRNNTYEMSPLSAETEAVIQDVLTGPEVSNRERVDAADELASLAFRLMPEAVEILTGIANTDTSARFRALSQLAWLDGPSRPETLRRVESMIADESLPARTRRLAAENLIYIDYQPNPVAIDFLRAVASDQNTAQISRINTLYALRHVDGPEPLRALRDDPRLTAAVRVEAAGNLIEFTADDRAAAATLLGSIGADRTTRPALRLRAANTLATLGAPGRQQAIETLTQILNDGTLPASSRAQAGWQLADIFPASRTNVIRALREIEGQAKPLHRIRVLAKLGAVTPEEAAPLLRSIAQDRTMRPATRLKAAEELADLHRDQYEPAAAVARELMKDEQIPWHIRQDAACHLAWWSVLCRQEARDMIRHLDTKYPGKSTVDPRYGSSPEGRGGDLLEPNTAHALADGS